MEKDMKNKYFCYIVLALFLFALLFQMMNVTLYFDDYGYLSLTYHKLGAGVNNGRYILINILQFLYNHYMNVGARVLYFFIFLVLGRIDISVMRLAQTAIIFFIIYIFAHHNKFCPYSVLTLVALYMALPLVIMSDGAYWFSASILYVFPMLPFLVGSILLIKTAIDSDKLTNCQKRIMYVSLFFASFSQEQISCATVFVLFICVALNMLRRRSIKLDSEISTALVITLIGFLLIVLCPGSRIRAAENQLPLLERIVKHSNSVILNLYHASGNVFQFPLIIITAFMGIFLYRKKAANIVYMLINTVLSAFLLFVSFKYYSGVYNGLATLTHYNWIVVRSVLYIYTLVIAVTVFYYCRYKKSLTELILFGGGIVSLAVIIAAPSAMPSRACLPYYIIRFGQGVKAYAYVRYACDLSVALYQNRSRL